MPEVAESRDTPTECEPKWFIQTKKLANFFNVDAKQWNRTKVKKWILSRIALSIVVIGLGYYTAKTSWSLAYDYAESPTSYTQKTSSSQSIALPLSVVCLPLSPIELDDYWADTENISLSENATHYQHLLADFFDNEVTTKEALLNLESPWPYHLLFVAHHYIDFIMQFEAMYGTQAAKNIDDLNKSYSDLGTAINILGNRIESLNVSANELKHRYGEDIKALFNLTIFLRKSSSEFVEIDSNLLSLEENTICFIARFDQHLLKREETINVLAQRSDLPNPRFDTYPGFTMGIYIGGRSSFGKPDEYNDAFFDSSVKFMPLQVASSFRSLPYINGKIQCNQNKSFDECTTECRRHYFREKCGCLPTFGSMKFIFNETVCNLKNYTTCFKEENISNSEAAHVHLVQCENSCVDMCERRIYFISKGSVYSWYSNETFYEQANSSIMRLMIVNFDYPIFEEAVKWTIPSFIGAFGGAVGLWLGINVLDIIIYSSIYICILINEGKKAVKTIIANTSSIRIESTGLNNDANERRALSSRENETAAKRNRFMFSVKTSNKTTSIDIFGIYIRILLGLCSAVIIGLAMYEYLSKRTVTTVQVEHNESLALPPATICLPLEFGELDYSYSFNEKKSHFTSELTKYSQMESNVESHLMPRNKRWNNAVRNVAHAYLSELTNCEIDFYEKCNHLFRSNKDLIVAMSIFERIISKLNISVDELRQRFGHEVAKIYSFYAGLYDYDELMEKIDSYQTNYVGVYETCYEIPFNLYPLKITSRFVIEVSEHSLPNPFVVDWDRSSMTLDFQNRMFFHGLEAQPGTRNFDFGVQTEFFMELTQYRTLPKEDDGEAHCNDIPSQESETLCRLHFIQDQCNCLPTSWLGSITNFNTSTTDICTMEKYKSCLNIEEIWDKVECSRQCFKSYEKTTVTTKDYESWHNHKGTLLYIRLDNMNVVVYKEQLAWSRDWFLGVIGGTVGFFLGYSLFEILCFGFLIVIWLFDVLPKKLKTSFAKTSQVGTTIEVRPAPNSETSNIEEMTESSDEANEPANFIEKLNKIGCKVNSIPWIAEHIFKLILFVCFTWLTGIMCLPTVMNFIQSSTKYEISLILNQPLSLQPATVCIDLIGNELDNIAQSDSPSDFTATKYEAEIRKYFSQPIMTKEKFFYGIGPWNIDLTEMSSKDSRLPEYFASKGIDTYRAFTLLEKNMNLFNISVNELRQKLGREVFSLTHFRKFLSVIAHTIAYCDLIASVFSLNVYQTTNCQGYAFCQNQTSIPIGEVTQIDIYSICYQLPLHRYPFNNSKQSLILTANSRSIANKRYNDHERGLCVYLFGRNNSDFNDRIFDHGQYAKTYFDERKVQRITVSAVYQSMISKGICNKYTTHETCLAECRIDLFRKICNCTPTSWSSWALLDTYEECSLKKYTTCGNYSGNDDFICIKENCDAQNDLCERWVIDIAYLQDELGYPGAQLSMQITSFDYPIFKEQYELSFEEFAGALGGAIGFYLGLDVLKILFAVCKAVSFLRHFFTVFKKSSNAEMPVVNAK